jgi:hypothetical protein
VIAGTVSVRRRHIIPSFIVRPRKAVMAFPQLAGLGVRQAEREWRSEILPVYRALVERSLAEVETAEPSALPALVDRLAEAAGRYFGFVTQVAGYSSKAEVPLARFYGANLRPWIGATSRSPDAKRMRRQWPRLAAKSPSTNTTADHLGRRSWLVRRFIGISDACSVTSESSWAAGRSSSIAWYHTRIPHHGRGDPVRAAYDRPAPGRALLREVPGLADDSRRAL